MSLLLSAMSAYTILDILYHVCFATILLPIWIGLWRWTKISRAEMYLVLLLISLLLVEIASDVLQFNRIRNHFLYYLQTIAVFWFSSLFYVQVRKWGNWPLWIALFITVLVPIEVIGWVGFNYINSATLTLSRLVLAGYAFGSLRQLVDDQSVGSLRTNPLFYQHCGFLIYGFFSAGTMYFRNYFIETSLDLYFFFDIAGVMMNAVAFILFGFSLLDRWRAMAGQPRRI